MRVQRLETTAAAVASIMLAEALDLPLRLGAVVIDMGHVQHTAAQIECRFDAVGNATPLAGTHNHAIHDDLDLMLAAVGGGRRVFYVLRTALPAHAGETLAAELLPKRLVFFFSPPPHPRPPIQTP